MKRQFATATIEHLNSRVAILEVNYPDETFTLTRLEAGRNERSTALYERGFSLATFNAETRGLYLERYSRVEMPLSSNRA
jgi:hypothetical protein